MFGNVIIATSLMHQSSVCYAALDDDETSRGTLREREVASLFLLIFEQEQTSNLSREMQSYTVDAARVCETGEEEEEEERCRSRDHTSNSPRSIHHHSL